MEQREIKFKAWIPHLKRMGTPFELKKNFAGIEAEVRDTGRLDPWYSDTIFLQFTGLKDKNGVEVYAGDIIASNTLAVESWTVVYRPNWGKYVLYSKTNPGKKVVVNSVQRVTRMQVIGNIYEKPELLTN